MYKFKQKNICIPAVKSSGFLSGTTVWRLDHPANGALNITTSAIISTQASHLASFSLKLHKLPIVNSTQRGVTYETE